MKQILITTVNRRIELEMFNYSFYEEDGRYLWVDELYLGEAGTKFALKRVEFDQIIYVGYDDQVEGTNETHYGTELVKKKLAEYEASVEKKSAELLHIIDDQRKEEIVSSISSFWEMDAGKILEHLVENRNSWVEFIMQCGPFSLDEIKWIQRFLYMSISEDKRTTNQILTTEMETSFVPVISSRNGASQLTGFDRLIREIKADPDEEINVYAVVGGLKQDDAFMFLGMLSAASENINMNLNLERLSGRHEIIPGFLYGIYDFSERLVANKLQIGLKAFINNGRSDIIRKYWESTGIENEYIEKLMYTMSTLESGMLLCNMTLIRKGILQLKSLATQEHTPAPDVRTEEEMFVMVVKDALMADCKPLLIEGTYDIDILELIKWMFRKGFYQQAITIIESKIPEDMVDKGYFYPCETEEEKEAYAKAFNAAFWNTSGRNRWMFDHINHYFVKHYGKGYTNSVYRNDPSQNWNGTVRASQVFSETPMGGLLPAHSIIEKEEYLIELIDLYWEISALRNFVHHGDCRKTSAPLPVLIDETVSRFLKLYSLIRESSKGKEFTAVQLDSKELKNYYYQNGPRDNPDFDKVPGFIRQR